MATSDHERDQGQRLEALQEAYDVQVRTLHTISGENIALRKQLGAQGQRPISAEFERGYLKGAEDCAGSVAKMDAQGRLLTFQGQRISELEQEVERLRVARGSGPATASAPAGSTASGNEVK